MKFRSIHALLGALTASISPLATSASSSVVVGGGDGLGGASSVVRRLRLPIDNNSDNNKVLASSQRRHHRELKSKSSKAGLDLSMSADLDFDFDLSVSETEVDVDFSVPEVADETEPETDAVKEDSFMSLPFTSFPVLLSPDTTTTEATAAASATTSEAATTTATATAAATTTHMTTAAATTDSSDGGVDAPEMELPTLGYVTETWRVPQGYPEGIAYDKANQRILLSSLASGTIISLDTTNNMERQTVYVPSIETPGSGMGLKVVVNNNDESGLGTPLVYATIGSFETMDKGGLAVYEMQMTEDQLAFAPTIDPSPYYMPCVVGDTMCGLANDVVVVVGDNNDIMAYVTDSMNGRVFKVENGVMDLVSEDALLQWDDFDVPFGANGLVYDSRGFLIVNNYQKATLVRVDLETGEVMNIPISGTFGNPDGMLMHSDGRLFVVTGTAIRVLRDEDNEWRSAVVVGMIDVDFSAEGEQAATIAFGEDEELYVTFVRFNDLFGGGVNQDPALLAKVTLGEVVAPVETTEAPATGSTETPSATTVAATDAPFVTTTAISTKAGKATTDGMDASLSMSMDIMIMSAKSAKANSMSMDMYLLSAKSAKASSMSMDVIISAKSGKAFGKTGKALFNKSGKEYVTVTTATSSTDAPITTATAAAKSSKASGHDDMSMSMPAKAAKMDASMSMIDTNASKASSNDESMSMPSTPVHSKSTKMAKGGDVLFEANIVDKDSSSASSDDESMSMSGDESVSSSKSGKSSGKSGKDGSMSMNTHSKSAKYRLFRSKQVRTDSLFN